MKNRVLDCNKLEYYDWYVMLLTFQFPCLPQNCHFYRDLNECIDGEHAISDAVRVSNDRRFHCHPIVVYSKVKDMLYIIALVCVTN